MATHSRSLYLRLTHVGLQELIVGDNRGVLDVEMAGNSPQLSDIQVATLLIKASHLALLQLPSRITYQGPPADKPLKMSHAKHCAKRVTSWRISWGSSGSWIMGQSFAALTRTRMIVPLSSLMGIISCMTHQASHPTQHATGSPQSRWQHWWTDSLLCLGGIPELLQGGQQIVQVITDMSANSFYNLVSHSWFSLCWHGFNLTAVQGQVMQKLLDDITTVLWQPHLGTNDHEL